MQSRTSKKIRRHILTSSVLQQSVISRSATSLGLPPHALGIHGNLEKRLGLEIYQVLGRSSKGSMGATGRYLGCFHIMF